MTEKEPSMEPKAPAGGNRPPSSSPGSGGSRKFLAVIVALLIVIVALSYLDINGHVFAGKGPTATVSTTQQFIDTGQQMNMTISAQSKFSYAHVYFGDNTMMNYTYNGSNKFNVSHVYNSPGNYFVFFKLFNGNSVYSSFNHLVQISVASKLSQENPDSSYGIFNLISSSTNGTVGNNTLIYKPGTNLSFALGYSTAPSNTSYQVVYQNVNVIGPFSSSDSVSYQFNTLTGQYQIPALSSEMNISNMAAGYYQVAVRTMTANLSATNVSGNLTYLGQINTSAPEYNTTFYEDIVIASSAGLYTPAGAAGSFLNAEVVNGVDNNMDFALQDTVNGQEVVDQVIQYLVAFNGSSDTQFMPELATQLPSLSNGGINSNYANYTQTTPWGATYTTHLKPYENYTFKISSNATYTDGSPVTAWDFLYSMARTIVLSTSLNSQGGYLAEFLLPGDIAHSNTFYNITQNITINNASNSITFHFQSPESTAVVYQLMATDGSEAESANWYIAHGAGLTWSPSGFQAYQKYGIPTNYNTYIENHLMSDGAYKLAYMVPGSEVVLVANPNFVSPGPWDPKPTIGQVTIEYVSSEPSAYLLMKQGAAQAGALPSANWNEVQSLVAANQFKVYHYNELSFNFFEFNANINESAVGKQGPGANLPQTLFMSQNMRKVFAYSFNYSEYINYQVGNKVFNTTFQIPYVGYLPVGAQYYESASALNASGSAVPYFNLNTARQYLNYYLNGSGNDNGAAMGVSWSSGKVMYNGHQLNIPIFIPNLHPSLLEAATSWTSALAKLGIASTQVQVPEDNIFVQTQANNYMPVAWGGWFSSFAFPNRIASIGLPTNLTSYIGAGDINPYWFSSASGAPTYNSTQVADMNQAIQDYQNAVANGTNSAVAKEWYWKANGMLVNASYVVFIGQGVGNWVLSTALNNQNILNYELNPFEAGVSRLMYAGLSYNTTT